MSCHLSLHPCLDDVCPVQHGWHRCGGHHGSADLFGRARHGCVRSSWKHSHLFGLEKALIVLGSIYSDIGMYCIWSWPFAGHKNQCSGQIKICGASVLMPKQGRQGLLHVPLDPSVLFVAASESAPVFPDLHKQEEDLSLAASRTSTAVIQASLCFSEGCVLRKHSKPWQALASNGMPWPLPFGQGLGKALQHCVE